MEADHLTPLAAQVVISLTLIFATVPLVHFTSDKAKMGEFVNGRIVTVRKQAAQRLSHGSCV